MKDFNQFNNAAKYQSSRKQANDNGNTHVDNKISNNGARSNNENGHIMEQILSDMAWYG